MTRSSILRCVLVTLALGFIVHVTPVGVADGAAQGRRGAGGAGADWTPPLTPDGQPDIQGFYNSQGLRVREENPSNLCPEGFVTTCYDTTVWYGGDPRGELTVELPMGLIDPPGGKLPLRPEAFAWKEEFKIKQASPESLEWVDTAARCLHQGLPRSSTFLALQIIQGTGYVVIFSEYNHVMRVIPLDQRPHEGDDIRLFGGDPVGRWEGNTLVIESTNVEVPPATGLGHMNQQGTPFSRDMRVTEKLTPVAPNTIAVEITIDDPTLYTQPWTIAGAFVRGLEGYQLFEYACHEGNYGLESVTHLIPKKK